MALQPNGDKYDGEWEANKMHGVGTYRWPNGRWRDGQWRNGERVRWLTEERIGGTRRK